MKPYTFYLHEARRAVPLFEFISCHDDEEARACARDLFDRRPGLVEVEIFDGRASRFRVGRPMRDREVSQQGAAAP
jgi:hypothetical protein